MDELPALMQDEVHWLSDPERGSAWTRYCTSILLQVSRPQSNSLIAARGYTHYRLCGALECEKILTLAFHRFCPSGLRIERPSRRSTLTVHPNMMRGIAIDQLRQMLAAGDTTVVPCAIVAFSRNAVLGVASYLKEAAELKQRVSVMYGAMPPQVRAEQSRYAAPHRLLRNFPFGLMLIE